MHSRESLAFIPQYMRDIPLVPQQLRRQEQRYQEMTGKPLDDLRQHPAVLDDDLAALQDKRRHRLVHDDVSRGVCVP